MQAFEPIGSSQEEQSFSALNDIYLGFIWNLRKAQEKTLYGFSVFPYVVFPTGDEKLFIGEKSTSFGLDFIFDWNFQNRKRKTHLFSTKVGYVHREAESIFNLTVGPAVSYSLGHQWLASPRKNLWITSEIFGEFAASNVNFNIASPAEILVGLKNINEYSAWTIGVGTGLNIGFGAPEFRVFAGFTIWGLPTSDSVSVPIVQKEFVAVAPVVEKKEVVEQKILAAMPAIQDIQFKSNSDELTPKSFLILQDVVQVVDKFAQRIASIKVDGHTDSYGDDSYNQNLSERRALTVRGYLLSHMAAKNIDVQSEGFGETRPLFNEKTQGFAAKNRRVEIQLKLK